MAADNETATMTATTRNGYKFVNCTKDGIEISNKNPHSFTVTEDVVLVANFVKDESGIESKEPASFLIYPNPTNGKLTIRNNGQPITNVSIIPNS